MQPDRTPPPRYWFLMKRFGWGWGPPVTWEGWVVAVQYVALMAAAGWAFPPSDALPMFTVSVTALTAALIAICFWKGEPPRWRWGD